ncbi:ABC transporter ATP-binding protein [Enterococcus sp. CSURQ0835]|uniref:ABC transporter ATP-binding protein n=1 Tax=Enterococcus sp. CSURQ0835 TaxID=2681394 RepID=UPI00135C14B4|nr:ABC transporter ATP-binding protein [Enterococcus sp. CSURQ0835]
MPRMHFSKPQDLPKLSWKFVSRILHFFEHYKLQLAGIILLTFGISLLGLVPPLLLQKIVDQALPHKNLQLLFWLVGFSITATIGLNLLQVAQGYLSTWVAKKITYNIKNQLYANLSHQAQSFFTTVKEGEIITRLTSDVDGIQQIFQTTVVNALTSVFILATSLIALIHLNPWLALVSMLTLPLFILPTRKVGQVRWQLTAKSQKKLSQLNQHVQETLNTSGSTLMKLFTNEPQALREFKTINQAVTALQLKESLAGRWFRMTLAVFTTIGPMLVYLAGGYLLIQGQISLGGIITFASLLTRMYNPVIQLSNIQVDFMSSFALFDRIFAYLDQTSPIKETTEPQTLSTEDFQLEFQDVSFRYQNEWALQHIQLTVKPGQTLALVGPSGAGKSTLTNLIPRLYDPTQGQILLAGQKLTAYALADLRQQIGVVTQEAYLFNTTIRENLLYAKPEATEEELIAATKAAYIYDFITQLPAGFETKVGNRGVRLSGGEKQRLAIARVILKDPKLLILDEATSALDALSERYVQKAMDKLLENRTSIVIAHRLSTIRDADQIAVLEKGRLVEQGDHQTLLQQNGLYAKLHATQFNLAKSA